MGTIRGEYHRLSIEKIKPEFTGWEHYIELIEQLKFDKDKAFFATMFELGCRIREVLGKRDSETKELVSPPLQRSNFLFTKPNRLIVVDIPILKRYKKLDHKIIRSHKIPDDVPASHEKLWHRTEEGVYERKVWTTERHFHVRRIEIPLDEPLMDYMLPYIKNSRGVLFEMSYDYYYLLCRKMDPLGDKYPKVPEHIFPHWWRSQRACQLAAEYGFELHKLLNFFEWKDIETAQMYAKLTGKLGDEMSAVKTTWRQNRQEFVKKIQLTSPLDSTPIQQKKKQKKSKRVTEEKKEKKEKVVDMFELLGGKS